MAREIEKKINRIIESRDKNLSQDQAEKAWRRMVGLYRLRFHKGYLIQTEVVILRMAKIIEEIYPNFGQSLEEAFNEIFNNSESAKVILNEIYPQLDLNFTQPATAEEKDVVGKILSFSSKPLPPSVKEEVLDFLFC
jgi:hypothetical protein